MLKILLVAGPLSSNRTVFISWSSYEAGLIADMTHGTELTLPFFTDRLRSELSAALGPNM